ncbi:hypothetical protein [Candidatus Nitrosocosmicus sp. SS]|uniref:hypothetical protein n=1 Tax=Candidatus Nitrosocosmicus agrestis TaxID=2563600 RepID=UPI00122DD3CA|nr:hypothetical protein [Candidatus Nitrosocosmicus sp. SS]KAA2279066.1 hypothetical protein F1Z66_14405 [Candidatus Nitrosocosmicus sp. SS]KAF0867645.1 hypothetical protein E5N71_14210 [Candidatus Nitrosocosmicus sp. SS]
MWGKKEKKRWCGIFITKSALRELETQLKKSEDLKYNITHKNPKNKKLTSCLNDDIYLFLHLEYTIQGKEDELVKNIITKCQAHIKEDERLTPRDRKEKCLDYLGLYLYGIPIFITTIVGYMTKFLLTPSDLPLLERFNTLEVGLVILIGIIAALSGMIIEYRRKFKTK